MTKRTIPSTDEAWDDRSLGADEDFVEVAPAALEKAADEASGTQLISIRMQKVMIDDLKAIAARNKNIGYQTLMKQVLQRFIEGEKRQLWNEFVSKKLNEEAPSTPPPPDKEPKEKKAA
jgi:hypothetical protein